MGMIKTDPTIDPLANGSTVKVCYHVEAKFRDESRGWRRNQQEHETVEDAEWMSMFFKKRADVRIVRVEVTERVVTA